MPADAQDLRLGLPIFEISQVRLTWSNCGISKKWSSCGISYEEMEQLWYFLLRKGTAVVFLVGNGAIVVFLIKAPLYKWLEMIHFVFK